MARKIAVEIVGDSSSLERAFARSSRGAQKFNSDIGKTSRTRGVLGGLGRAAGFATGALGIGGLAGAAKASFDEMQQSQQVSAQTVAALRSTHGVANVTAGHIDDLAGSLLKLSGVDDEAIKSNENLLLTFTNVRNEAGKGNDIFDQATTTVLDMSTALGEDGKSASIQLGKALNDPIKGITALRRVGVQFTDDQKNQIKAMVASGNTMGAQKVILKELNKEFGGSAKAAGDTLPGKLNILRETLRNLGGSIATQLAPQIKHVVTQMVDWLSKSRNQKQIMDIVHGAVNALKTGVNFLKGAFQLLSGVVGGNKRAIEFLAGAFVAFKIVDKTNRVLTFAGSFANLANTILGKKGPVAAAETLAGGLSGKAGLAGATEEAAGGVGGLATALGPAVLGVAALAAGAAIGTLLYQIPLVKQVADEAADSIAHMLGYRNPLAQFGGVSARTITQSQFQTVRSLSAQGLTAPQIAARHPGWSIADIRNEIAAAGRARAPVNHYHITNMSLHGIQDPQAWADELARLKRRTPHVR